MPRLLEDMGEFVLQGEINSNFRLPLMLYALDYLWEDSMAFLQASRTCARARFLWGTLCCWMRPWKLRMNGEAAFVTSPDVHEGWGEDGDC